MWVGGGGLVCHQEWSFMTQETDTMIRQEKVICACECVYVHVRACLLL